MSKIPAFPYPKDLPHWTSPTEGTDLPYDFVPVLPERYRPPEAPIWHHGANPNQKELLSGELRCTLKTRTPLIIGNEQVKFEALTEAWRDKITAQLHKLGIEEAIAPDKHVLFPLTLGEDGPVLIPGESLKGMFRHALGALLNVPMERVQEETFSYRPNVKVGLGQKTKPVAAQVVAYDPDRCLLQVRLIENLNAIQFLSGPPPRIQGQTVQPGRDYQRQDDQYRYLRYHHGLDCGGYFRTYAREKRGLNTPGEPKTGVWVKNPNDNIESQIRTVDPAVVRQYLDTLEHLKDHNHGHLSRNYLGNGPNPKDVQLPQLTPGDLIFGEMSLSSKRLVSFGHNFRYRWKHLNSVTQHIIAFDSEAKAWIMERRPEMTAHEDEHPENQKPPRPQALTAVRNLVGYVAQEKHPELGKLQKLKSPFDHLAGRIAFNIACEHDTDNPWNERFLEANADSLVFLHPLAQPKPSFWRGYVPGASADEARTWGDGILKLMHSKTKEPCYGLQYATRYFAGRKFYRHQLAAAHQAYHYNLYDLLALPQHKFKEKTAHSRQDLQAFLTGNQAAIARQVSQPGRRFGFTVRFKNLRPWELAALVAVLCPDRLAEAIRQQPDHFRKTWQWLENHQDGFGHKLGHGRPLGLGSIQITIDHIEGWHGPLEVNTAFLSQHLLPCLDDEVTCHWLRVLRLQPEREVRPYLLHHGSNGPQTIVQWNQNVRSQHLNHTRGVQRPHHSANRRRNPRH